MHISFKKTLLASLLLNALFLSHTVLAQTQFVLEMPKSNTPSTNNDTTSSSSSSPNNTTNDDPIANMINRANQGATIPDSNSFDTNKTTDTSKNDDNILFVQDNAPPPPPDYSNMFSVIIQSQNPDYEKIEARLSSGQNVNQVIMDGDTMLHLAAAHNDIQLAQIALKHKANIKLKNNDGDMPLQLAAGAASLNIVNLLLNAGSDINYKDKQQRTALHSAVLYYDNADIINELVAKGADLTAKDDMGETPVHYAAVLGHWAQLDALLKHGGNLSIADKDGETPEQMLMRRGSLDNMIYFYSYLNDTDKNIVKEKSYGYKNVALN